MAKKIVAPVVKFTRQQLFRMAPRG